jgi:surface antigen
MRLTALLVGVTLAGVVFQNAGTTVSAETGINSKTDNQAQALDGELLALLNKDDNKEVYKVALAEWVIKEETEGLAKPEKQQPKTHTVVSGDTLTRIANEYDTEWVRLWEKNAELKHPDQLKVGQKLTIPESDEKLAKRELPDPPVQPAAAAVAQAAPARTQSRTQAPSRQTNAVRTASVQTSAPRGSSSGNLYVPGYCTWYVKNQRPDLPNNLGNADTWVSRARAQGLPTGSTPRAGAVGQRGMHVVYVKSVNSDGSVNISEMNHKGLYVITHRTLPGNYFQYIYR